MKISKNYENKPHATKKQNIFGTLLITSGLGTLMEQKKDKVKKSQKWEQTFNELKLLLKIFIRNRKYKTVSENIEEFSSAVTNNSCCTWLKQYFYNPNLIDELEYRKFHHRPEILNGLGNLIDDLG